MNDGQRARADAMIELLCHENPADDAVVMLNVICSFMIMTSDENRDADDVCDGVDALADYIKNALRVHFAPKGTAQ